MSGLLDWSGPIGRTLRRWRTALAELGTAPPSVLEHRRAMDALARLREQQRDDLGHPERLEELLLLDGIPLDRNAPLPVHPALVVQVTEPVPVGDGSWQWADPDLPDPPAPAHLAPIPHPHRARAVRARRRRG